MPLEITDPQSAPQYAPTALSRFLRSMLHEERDEVFLRLSLSTGAIMVALMVSLALVLQANMVPAWIPMLAYFAAWGWFAPPIILMLHNTMHRRFIRSPRVLEFLQPYVISLLMGIPTGYREHHVGMHHAEDNLWEDLSSTIRYRRDNFAHFLVYFSRFFFTVGVELPIYLWRKKRYSMARRAAIGELVQLSVVAVALLYDWRFGLAAFAAPVIACRFMMMAGNWGQHAFINVDRLNNGIANSITCINSGYNARCFNDGYHIGHHLKANRHWTELPADFMANQERYAREGALVFKDIDFFMVSVLLWTGRWDILAKKFVRLGGQELSDEQVIALLKSRVAPIRQWAQEPLAAA